MSFQEENLKALKQEIENKHGIVEYFLADVSKIEEVEKISKRFKQKWEGGIY
jgi:short-subunit dehydrogenase